MDSAVVALPDGTVIAGVQSMAIEQTGAGLPVLTLRIVDFDVEIMGITNRKPTSLADAMTGAGIARPDPR